MRLLLVLFGFFSVSWANVEPQVGQIRDVIVTPAMKLRASRALVKTAKECAVQLQQQDEESTICSSQLKQLMELLGLPADMDGAVEMAQQTICGGEVLRNSVEERHLKGFIDTVLKLVEKLRDLGQGYVCSTEIREIMRRLRLPSSLVWALETAKEWFCSL